MNALQRAAAAILAAIALPAVAASAAAPADSTRRTPFTHFGAKEVLALRGDGAVTAIEFGSRADELVTRATFHFRYAHSPALAPGSEIRLSLNDAPIGVLPIVADGSGAIAARAIEVDPRLIVGHNRLVMSLAATRGGADDAARPGLWAEASGASELEIAVQPLAVADDLAILPEPFFDRRDQRRVTIPFVLAARPSTATLRAAAVVASWFGQHASWRGARFPVQLDAPAPGHAIAFAANGERPAFLAALPPVPGPRLRLMTNPADGRSRLLVVMGRDGNDLKVAADALALGGVALAGAAVDVKPAGDPGPRAAYDAPRWVRLDRPMRLGELVEGPQQLQASGRPSELQAIRLDLRVPPDLVTSRGRGVPLLLKLQYTPPACTADANLDVSLDDEPLQVLPLSSAAAAATESREVLVPGSRLRGRNRLHLDFRFTPRDAAGCGEPQAPVVKAAVSADSTIDFTGFPHYARMPNLEHFASMGFPFTRFADLSQTVAVLPDNPAAADIEALLGIVARMGEATGYPATRLRIAAPRDEALLADADLLLIGATPQQALLVKWAAAVPAAGGPGRASPPSPVGFEGMGPVASLHGFESPLTSGRSVIAITALAPDQVLRVLDALDDRDMGKEVRGSAAFVFPYKVQSLVAGPAYSVGFLPPWTGAGDWLSRHPVVLGALAAAVLAGLAVAAWGLKRKSAAWRVRSRA